MIKILGKFKFGLAALALTSALIFRTTPVFASGTILNEYLVSNTQNPAWAKSVSANVGDVVQYHSKINNGGNETLKNICVRADLPTSVSGSSIVSTFHIKADNASEVTDSATVTFADNGKTKNLVYFPGHAFLIRHPGNQQSTFEIIGDQNWHCVGDLDMGDQFFLEVLFKAQLTENTPQPSATPTVAPTATPTVAPTATPTVAPTASPTSNPQVQCPSGTTYSRIEGNNIICINNNNTNNNTNNNSQSQTVNVTNTVTNTSSSPAAQVIAASTSNVKELPNTGLPLAGLALTGLTPLGLKLKRFGKGVQALSPSHIWEMREFNKD